MTEKDFIELKVQLARIEENVSQLPELKSEVKHLNMTLGETNARSLQNERDIDRMRGISMVKLESVHGGHNSVAVGVRKGSYKEEVLADALAKRVAELTGARYIPQDTGDVNQNLAYFVREMDKKRGANLSIHFNAFNGSAHGTESFSYAGDSIGKSISTNMSSKVSNVLGTFNRGNKNAPAGTRFDISFVYPALINV